MGHSDYTIADFLKKTPFSNIYKISKFIYNKIPSKSTTYLQYTHLKITYTTQPHNILYKTLNPHHT